MLRGKIVTVSEKRMRREIDYGISLALSQIISRSILKFSSDFWEENLLRIVSTLK